MLSPSHPKRSHYTELNRRLKVAEREKAEAMEQAKHFSGKSLALEKALAEYKELDVDGLLSKVPKLKPQSSTFYDHVNFFYRWAKRYDAEDVPQLVACGLAKLGGSVSRHVCTVKNGHHPWPLALAVRKALEI